MKSTKSAKNRRRQNRWDVAVLVRCALPKYGDEIFELEMWAKDVNESGLKLELTKGLQISHITKEGEKVGDHAPRMDDLDFKKGSHVKIQDLFYDDDGSPFIDGKVAWAKHLPHGGWSLGIQFAEPKKQSKEFRGSFKDFLSVVKNPLGAIKKASLRE